MVTGQPVLAELPEVRPLAKLHYCGAASEPEGAHKEVPALSLSIGAGFGITFVLAGLRTRM